MFKLRLQGLRGLGSALAAAFSGGQRNAGKKKRDWADEVGGLMICPRARMGLPPISENTEGITQMTLSGESGDHKK